MNKKKKSFILTLTIYMSLNSQIFSSIASTLLNQNTATSSYETKGSGIVSGSSQITPLLPTGTISGSSQITIEAVTSVAGIASGNLPTSSLNVTDFKVLTTSLQSSSDNTLYTKLSKSNVATVDLSEANLTIRKIFNVNIISKKILVSLSLSSLNHFRK